MDNLFICICISIFIFSNRPASLEFLCCLRPENQDKGKRVYGERMGFFDNARKSITNIKYQIELGCYSESSIAEGIHLRIGDVHEAIFVFECLI